MTGREDDHENAIYIAPKTAEKYITAQCKGGQLVRFAQGKYEKA